MGNEGTSVVAVKTLKENANEKERSDLVQELQVMKMLEPHPNVVRLLGCCTEKDPLFVIMEFVPHGKLQSFLRSSRAERFYGNLHGPSNTLTSRDLTTFVYQVARGMEFLSAKGNLREEEGQISRKCVHICRGSRVENHLGENYPQYTRPESDPDLSIIGSLVYCKSDVLDHAATETGISDFPKSAKQTFTRKLGLKLAHLDVWRKLCTIN
uniref:Protein kinase domain-containing protein n=1 Tax=Timema shepardi TaxID=629360 RepID=A0A7R9FWL9_TIMSH|nr:unnamed protein product [Timema shepardi]